MVRRARNQRLVRNLVLPVAAWYWFPKERKLARLSNSYLHSKTFDGSYCGWTISCWPLFEGSRPDGFGG